MKTLSLILMIASLLALNSCCTGSKNVPNNVKTTFLEKFPDVKKVVWEQEDKNEWEAEFTMNGKDYSANFNVDGSLVETEYEINLDEIPESVQNTLDSEFAEFEIEEAEYIERPEGVFYEFEIEKEDIDQEEVEMEVFIDSNGMVVKKEILKDEDDEDDDDTDNDN